MAHDHLECFLSEDVFDSNMSGAEKNVCDGAVHLDHIFIQRLGLIIQYDIHVNTLHSFSYRLMNSSSICAIVDSKCVT